ncbi:hypothetical protein H5P28_03300 [Ruficoccus amylovorans]|uniref:DUF1579 domain-containing protein n=1 Tax=Ruficoccus amylovorans TaxID=1804625 RepID=A0A842HAG7_9BACT|nr:hypothetical protein [Ruficoccus amylovorans]MBC2593280.1 hypothetical protein [Ruficoccus amylovorans]
MLTRSLFALLASACALAPLHAQTDATAQENSALVSSPVTQDESPAERTARLNAVLDRYQGRWVGTIEIRSLTRVIQTIQIEQQYWWDEIDGIKVLKGQAVLASMGTLSASESRTYIEAGNIYSETDQEGRQHFFIGKVSDDGRKISWLPADDADPLARKVTDTFSDGPEGPVLTVEGYEEVPVGDNRALLTMRGELKRAGDMSHGPLAMPQR